MTPRTRLLVSLAVIGGLLLAGCGGDDDANDAHGATAAPPRSDGADTTPTITPPPSDPTETTAMPTETSGSGPTSTSGSTSPTETTEQTSGSTPTSTSPTGGPTEPPQAPAGEVPVVLYTVQGLFPVTPPFLGEGPQLALYADGTVLAPSRADAAVAPQVWPFLVGHVDADEVQRLLDEAASAGLLADPPYYGFPIGMSDPPRTTLVLTTANGTFTHVADGLAGTTDDPARLALRGFVGKLASLELESVSPTDYYEPTRIGVVAAPVDTANLVVDWPDDGVDLDAATACTVIDDPATIALLQSSTRGTGFRQDGATYALAARVILPGTPC